MASIDGIEGKSNMELAGEVRLGAKFVVYGYCVSALIVTFRRSSGIQYIKPGESAVVKGLPYTLLSLGLGWWGIPWGLIYTPAVLYTNLRGGKDVTDQVMAAFAKAGAT